MTLSFFPWQVSEAAIATAAAEAEHGRMRADEIFAAANAGLSPGALAQIIQDEDFMAGAPLERAFLDRLQEHLEVMPR